MSEVFVGDSRLGGRSDGLGPGEVPNKMVSLGL